MEEQKNAYYFGWFQCLQEHLGHVMTSML